MVTAKSTQDTTKTATAAITVAVPNSVTSVAVNPSTLSLNTSTTNQFSATVAGTGSYSSGVTWTAQKGTITSAGLYTAPATSGSDVVTATSVQDATKTASTTVTVLASTTTPSAVIVAPNGVASNPGTLTAPTTPEGAQVLIQKAIAAKSGTLNVQLRGGVYPRSATLSLGVADSGTASNPVQWAAYPGETPRLIGGVAVNPASLHLVDSTDPNWSRLDPAARSLIYVVDLTAYQASFGTFASRIDVSYEQPSKSFNQAMEVFVDGVPLTLSRYPKAVELASANVAPKTSIHVSGTLTPDVTGDYAYKGLDSLGRPYYQLAKGGDVWSIAEDSNSPAWGLTNRTDLGGTGTLAAWGEGTSLNGPLGFYASAYGASSGTAFLSPTDGSDPLPGFMLILGTNGTTQITAPNSHMSRWNASEAMYFGMGYYGWSASHSQITSLDSTTGSIVLSKAPNFGLLAGQPFFIYNLLEELTAPGEYFIDRTHARLYLRPNGDVPPGEVLLSTLQTPIVQMTGCQNITWQGISFEAAKDHLVYGTNCQSVGFNNCQFQNSGGYGLILSGYSNLVEACDFRQLGKGGVWVWGGDRKTLTPSGTLIENSQFQYYGRLFWTYQPAIQIVGDYIYNDACMGFTVQHNEIHHSPHAAILFSGNGNTIQYNHIHDVVQWTNDAGAIYTTGCEWGMQGNLIQYNLIRNGGSPLGYLISGIYIDGAGSGVTIQGNILYHANQGGPAILHNGGRDIKTQYNIFYGHWYGLNTNNLGCTIITNVAGSQVNFLEKLQHFNYQTAPWSTTYPNLAQIPNSWSLLQGTHWLEPEGSVCYGNLQFGTANKAWSKDVYRETNVAPALGTVISHFSQVGSNLSQVDPQFNDPANLDFSLKSTSPMFTIPGFPGIDTTKIGIQK